MEQNKQELAMEFQCNSLQWMCEFCLRCYTILKYVYPASPTFPSVVPIIFPDKQISQM